MICVYLSDNNIKVVQGGVSGKKLKLRGYGEKETESASLESSVIKDKTELARQLQDIIETGAMKDKRTLVVMDNARLVLKEMELPNVPEKRLKLLLQNEIFPDGKMQGNVIDYVINETFVDEKKKKRLNASITFMSKDVVKDIRDILLEIDLKPEVIDVAPNAISKLISTYAKEELDEDFILLDYKTSFVSLFLFSKGKKRFSKSVVMYARPIMDNRDEYDYFINELIGNIQSVMMLSQSKHGVGIERIYLTGNVLEIKDSLQDIADQLSVGVRQLPPPASVKGIPVIDFNKYCVAVGAFYRR